MSARLTRSITRHILATLVVSAVTCVGCARRDAAQARSELMTSGSDGPGVRGESASALRRGVAVFHPDGTPVPVAVEIAETAAERARGLMYRKQLPDRAGMLFIFDRVAIQSFWMKNTYVSLDMIFIAAVDPTERGDSGGTIANAPENEPRGRVVGVIEHAAPMTTVSRSVAAPSRYVVEVNAGFANRHGIKVGTSVALPK